MLLVRMNLGNSLSTSRGEWISKLWGIHAVEQELLKRRVLSIALIWNSCDVDTGFVKRKLYCMVPFLDPKTYMHTCYIVLGWNKMWKMNTRLLNISLKRRLFIVS